MKFEIGRKPSRPTTTTNPPRCSCSSCRQAANQPDRSNPPMAAAATEDAKEKELLSSVVGDIRSYSGSDPLRPWLRGLRKMERALLPATLREKLPRFLQKCAQEFQDDARYRDDPRYLRVWIQLMDYVTDAKPLLKKMERNGIGLKRASFYMAYALYYEKHKRFNDAEKMYCLGIQNLAEPIGELHRAHEQFGFRMESYKRKNKERMPRKPGSSAASMNQVKGESRNSKEQKSNTKQTSGSSSNPSLGSYPPLGPAKVGMLSRGNSGANKNLSRCNSDDTVVVRFIGSALVGKSETEDACHHGLVEPTTNTKEALDAINGMFMEPLEPETILKRRSKRENPNYNQQGSAFDIFVDGDEPSGNDTNMLQNNSVKQDHTKLSQQTIGFEIYVDEDGPNGNDQNGTQNRNSRKENMKLNQEPSVFEIFVDEDGPNDNNQNAGRNRNCGKENMKVNQDSSGFEIFVDENEANGTVRNAMCYKSNRYPPRPLSESSKHQGESDFQKPFVGGFAILPNDEEQCEESYGGANIISRTVQPTHDTSTLLCPVQGNSGTRNREGPHPLTSGIREDTVIRRFVGSTIDDEPKVENACHHGLVDPTVNLKEAMDDINNMFGKPLNFKGERIKSKTNAQSDGKVASVSGFSILADDDLKENSTSKSSQSNSCKFGYENGLFEPTITTRDVMAEINDMFGMPLDL
ncbi:probable inactive serine/threonine-protein kinase bub1 [Sorghum bicolor]|nr:probable inactive serine/threonine-protein kinase bub1 [Sorghum bicolor]|eukprot:XP_021301438.1 probable inactive serine/threonine-protein kinase bub1 [Sorghum bicolor]